LSGINFSEGNRSSKGLSSFGIFGGEALAVSAPGGIEFNEDILVSTNNSVKILFIENQNSFFLWHFTVHSTEDEEQCN
jgi:hypothetical protein